MTIQKKVKLIISLAILIIIALCVTVVFQVVNISKINKEIHAQEKQIQQLENQLDAYSKLPGTDYEEIK